jgi:hypothetical protein
MTIKKKRKARLKTPSKLNRWFYHYTNSLNKKTFMNGCESSIAAEYKAKDRQSHCVIGSQNLTKLKVKINKWLDDEMLSEDALKKKMLSLMEAKETKFFAHEGKITDRVEIEAIETQRKTLDMAIKVKDMYAPTKHQVTGKDGKKLEWTVKIVKPE